MNWKTEPFKSAKRLTGNKDKALEIIELFKLVKEIGLTNYEQINI